MSVKKQNKTLSKGERLGWTPFNEMQPIALSVEMIKGKKVTAKQAEPNGELSYLIP